MTVFSKRVKCNTHDLDLAIRTGMGPMQTFLDETRDHLPFFGNEAAPNCRNDHSPTFSAAHIPGRWLTALLHAEEVTGIPADEAVIGHLRRWAFATLEEGGIGFPACLDLEKMTFVPETDLHNLRETMHALYALVRYRQDEHALALALGMIRTLDKYFDYDACRFDEARYQQDTGARIAYSCCHPDEGLLFPVHFGRYIGPLVKLWKATGEPEALRQAVRLKDACFRHILLEAGAYDVKRFGGHLHSTTAMLSSLAQLGEATGDGASLARIDAFFRNGLRDIALPFGWCKEGFHRRDLVGEINNTSDIMEVCLILGRHGYAGYYAMAEQILRAHFLPAQLLDAAFIPDTDDAEDPGSRRMGSRAIGAFGFPTPYGHEDHPGAWISFNWDIVGGGVNGLCEAWKAVGEAADGVLTLPLHFAADRPAFAATDPYLHGGVQTITVKQDGLRLKVRIPERATLQAVSVPHAVAGEWLYTAPIAAGGTVTVTYDLAEAELVYPFCGREIRFRWHGEEVTAANNDGLRLCWFDTI